MGSRRISSNILQQGGCNINQLFSVKQSQFHCFASLPSYQSLTNTMTRCFPETFLIREIRRTEKTINYSLLAPKLTTTVSSSHFSPSLTYFKTHCRITFQKYVTWIYVPTIASESCRESQEFWILYNSIYLISKMMSLINRLRYTNWKTGYLKTPFHLPRFLEFMLLTLIRDENWKKNNCSAWYKNCYIPWEKYFFKFHHF